MNRLEQIRVTVDQILLGQVDDEERRCGYYVHLYGVSTLCALLAAKRGLDPELAATAGMLHDIYSYRTGLTAFHAHNSEEDARVILRDSGLFSQEEQALIRSAIFHHSDKDTVDQPFDELVKDADVLQHYLYNVRLPVYQHELPRLKRAYVELSLPWPETVEVKPAAAPPISENGDKRMKLAEIAEALAAKPLVGNDHKSGPDLYPLLRYFPGATPQQGFDWCAAFVYHCCMQAGFTLPIKHPGPVPSRFAGVPAWLAWAQLPSNQFYTPATEADFTPRRGDIVIYDRLVSSSPHDHIGVILGYRDGVLTTAEGNVDNRSGIFTRDRLNHINGFIRIDNTYQYR